MLNYSVAELRFIIKYITFFYNILKKKISKVMQYFQERCIY